MYRGCNAHDTIVISCQPGCKIFIFTLFHKRHALKKKLLNIKCVFWLSLQPLCGTFQIIRGTERDMNINVYLCSCKLTLILATSHWNLNILNGFSKKNAEMSNCWSMQTDGRTDRHGETNSHIYVNAPLKYFTNVLLAQYIWRVVLGNVCFHCL
jgi:hypothetical protein